MLRDTAAVLEPIHDDVVVIGALAVQMALDGARCRAHPNERR